MRSLSILIVSALLPGVAWGAFEPKCGNARSASLGGLFTSFDDGESVRSRRDHLSLLFSPGLFNLPELAQASARYSRWYGSSQFSFSLSRFGGDLYRESEGGCAADLALDTLTRIGATGRIMHLGIKGYGTAVAGALSIFGSVETTEGLAIHFVALNLLAGKIGDDRIPRMLAAGAYWHPAEHISLILEGRIESAQQNAWSGGAEWELVPGGFLRMGMSTDHPGVDGGFGLIVGDFVIEYSFRWHRDLGGSHFIGLDIASPV